MELKELCRQIKEQSDEVIGEGSLILHGVTREEMKSVIAENWFLYEELMEEGLTADEYGWFINNHGFLDAIAYLLAEDETPDSVLRQAARRRELQALARIRIARVGGGELERSFLPWVKGVEVARFEDRIEAILWLTDMWAVNTLTDLTGLLKFLLRDSTFQAKRTVELLTKGIVLFMGKGEKQEKRRRLASIHTLYHSLEVQSGCRKETVVLRCP